jgi:peptidoglycan/xylan/chitin deacetylase (PgdA/CDA1 family)
MPQQQVGEPLQKLHLLYHELRPSGSRYSYVLDTSEFERHIQLFSRIQQSTDVIVHPEVTFDDGHISNFEFAAAILEAHGLQASFFITVGWTGRRAGYMGWEELRTLHGAGHRIGAHGWSHALLTHCSADELHKELSVARQTLEDKLGTSIQTMSLPGGRYNRRVLSACWQAGYAQVYTSVPRAENLPLGTTVGRLNIRGDMKLEWITDLFSQGNNALAGLERQYRVKAAAKSLLGDPLYEKVWALLNRREPEMDAGEITANEDTARH